jgi:hypothetical protein
MFLTRNDADVVDVNKREAIFIKVIISVHNKRQGFINHNSVPPWEPIAYARLVPLYGELSIQGHIIHFQYRLKGTHRLWTYSPGTNSDRDT